MDVLERNIGGIEDQPQARLAVKGDLPEPVTLAAVVIGGQEGGEMPQGSPLRPHADGLAVESGAFLGIEEPLDPEERGAVLDGARPVELLLLDQEAAAAGGVDHPAGAAGDLLAVGLEAKAVRAT